METLLRLTIGVVFSLFVGHLLIKKILKILRTYIRFDVSGINVAEREIPPWLVGILERSFFTVVIAFDVSAAGAAIMAWVAIKMATDWNRINVKNVPPSGAPPSAKSTVPINSSTIDEATLRVFALSALYGSLLSMFFALIGGLICKGDIWWWPR